MERISDKRLAIWIDWAENRIGELHSALVELRERRAKDKSSYTWVGDDPQHPPDAATGREK